MIPDDARIRRLEMIYGGQGKRFVLPPTLWQRIKEFFA